MCEFCEEPVGRVLRAPNGKEVCEQCVRDAAHALWPAQLATSDSFTRTAWRKAVRLGAPSE